MKLAVPAQEKMGLIRPLAIPAYLEETYWWAYVHPNAVSLFERQWLVNLILWGNFSRLRDAALDLWNNEISTWFPEGFAPLELHKKTYYGGLYQKVVIRV